MAYVAPDGSAPGTRPPGYGFPQGQQPQGPYQPNFPAAQMTPSQMMQQPQQPQQLPPPPPGCPPGLEVLIPLGQIFIKQHMEMLEVIFNYETNNRYNLYNCTGQQIYYAEENTDCCTRQICGPDREFNMPIMDPTGRGFHLYRPFTCCCAKLEVSAGGILLGTIEQRCTFCAPPVFDVRNESGQPIFVINGPCCTDSCCGSSVPFPYFSAADPTVQVGTIMKQWSGFGQEYFTDADNFGISFPVDLDVKMKAVLIGACILIDFKFYERKGNKD